MYKMLFIEKEFEPFKSSWGAMSSPQKHNRGYLMPLGWERELNLRGISYVEIEIELEKE